MARINKNISEVKVSKRTKNTQRMLFLSEELFYPCLTKILLYSLKICNLLHMLVDMNYSFSWQEVEEQDYIATCILKLGAIVLLVFLHFILR